MNPEDTIMICRYVAACCPQQAIDEFTPQVWHDHLEPFPYEQVKTATKALTANKPFVQISELVSEVKRIRHKNYAEGMAKLSPPEWVAQSDDPQAYISWMRVAGKALSDGADPESDTRELKPRNLGDLRALIKPIDPAA